MAASARLSLSLCTLLMANLFAFSASVQLNDPDWYLWFPLYAAACAVNAQLVRGGCKGATRQVTKFAFGLGVFLFIKVVLEDFAPGTAGLWSTDMRERVVREKFGSALVVLCMLLHLQASATTFTVDYGMPILVAVGYGLSLVFLVFYKRETKF